MSDEAALLAAIRANPEEDTPRLVYADWLDEHATADAQRGRAELIRPQCELRRVSEKSEPDRGKQLNTRVDELVAKFGSEWVTDFPLAKKERYFSRGFLWRFTITAAQCLKRPRPPWYREPFVTLGLSGTVKDTTKLVKRGWLNGLWG